MAKRLNCFFSHFFKKFSIAILFFSPALLLGQNLTARKITLYEAMDITLQNNPLAKNTELKLQSVQLHKKSIVDLPGTNIHSYYGQVNSSMNDRYIEINQKFGSIPVYIYKNKTVKNEIKVTESEQQILLREIKAQVKTRWFQWIYAYQKVSLINKEFKAYDNNLRFLNDSISNLDSITLERLEVQTKYAEAQNRLFQATESYKIATNEIKQILFTDDDLVPFDTIMELYAIDVLTAGPDKFYPYRHINYYSEMSDLKRSELKVEQAKLFPDFFLGYFNQEINHIKGFQGITAGLSIPLWFVPQKARIKEAHIAEKIALNELDYQRFTLQKKVDNLRIKLDQLYVQITYYRENALVHANAMEKAVFDQYAKKQIGDDEFLQYFNTIQATRLDYLGKILDYNTTAVELEYYIN